MAVLDAAAGTKAVVNPSISKQKMLIKIDKLTFIV